MKKPDPSPPSKTFFLQVTIVCSLVFQSCSYVLMRKYVQIQTLFPDSNLILFVGEVQKFLFSIAMILLFDEECRKKKFSEFCSGGLVMLVPAGAYLVMNLLSYFALRYISGSLFITVAQLKILTTAMASLLILKTSLSHTKWFSLLLLVIGSILVTQQEQSAHSSHTRMGDDDSETIRNWTFFVGLFAVILEVTISGLVSAYYEKILKNYNASIWERNLQLSSLSMIMYYTNFTRQHGFVLFEELFEWNWAIMVTATLGAAGGILVAICLKYLDSVVKCVVLSFSVSATLFLPLL
jgi:solute carrier family 35 (UDP-sugar transporter), member A1/2/3